MASTALENTARRDQLVLVRTLIASSIGSLQRQRLLAPRHSIADPYIRPYQIAARLRLPVRPLDRDNRPPLPPAPAAPQPSFEVEYLGRWAQSGPQERLRRQRCDMVAGGASAARNLLADKLVVADLGTAGFKVVGDLVIITRDAAEQRL